MNKCSIIGNLTRDPELRTVNTVNGQVSVCDFTVAVNRRQRGQNANNGQNEADFFRCTVWRGLADVASRYLHKGSKVFVAGPVSVRTYQGNDGTTRASLELTVEDFEFVDSRNGSGAPNAAPAGAAPEAPTAQNNGFPAVEADDLPF